MVDIAVVIPAFKSAPYIGRTLASVFRQSLPPAQVIVVDDGSPDDSAAIAEAFGASVVYHPGRINRGISHSRNLGLSHVTAPYVAFLDADDVWEPTFLEMASTRLKLGADVVVQQCRAIDTDDRQLFEYAWPTLSTDLAAQLLLDCFIQSPGQAVVKRELLPAEAFDPGLFGTDDHDLWVRLAELHQFIFLADIGLNYRKSPTQASQATGERMWGSGLAVVSKACTRRHYGPVARRRRAVVHYRLAMAGFSRRAYLSALGHAGLAFCYHPLRALDVIARGEAKQR